MQRVSCVDRNNQRKKRLATPPRRFEAKQKKVVDEREAIEVVCRLCPLKSDSDLPCVVVLDDRHVKLIPPSTAPKRNGEPAQDTIYKLSHVFDEDDGQRTVFQRTAVDLIENLVRGRNSLLFTYGVTGSGKTYTMTGDATEQNAGILPRTLDVLFNSLPLRADKCVFYPDGHNHFVVVPELEAAFSRRMMGLTNKNRIDVADRYVESQRVSGICSNMICAVFVSYIEIYNDACYDLLDEPAVGSDGVRVLKAKDIRLGVKNSVHVDRLIEVEVDSSNEALEQFFRGEEKRRFADTLLNKRSSRSHSVFNIRLVMAPREKMVFYPQSDPKQLRVAQLSLVDLAGSERTKRTCNEGARLVETGKINQSLLVLRQCFEKLRDNQHGARPPVPIPYRDSKLTQLFRCFFEGTGKIRMIICLNPRMDDYVENLAVMSFAELSQRVDVALGKEVASNEPIQSAVVFNHRDYFRWCKGLEAARTNPVIYSVDSSIPKISFELFSDPHSLSRLRDYYQGRLHLRRERCAELMQKEDEFEEQLKELLFKYDQLSGRLREAEDQRDRGEQTIAKLRAELVKSKRENLTLVQRVRQYEQEENEKAKREKEQNLRNQSYMNEICRKEKTSRQMREIFNLPIASHYRPRVATDVTSAFQALRKSESSSSGDSSLVSSIRQCRRNVVSKEKSVVSPRRHRRSSSINLFTRHSRVLVLNEQFRSSTRLNQKTRETQGCQKTLIHEEPSSLDSEDQQFYNVHL